MEKVQWPMLIFYDKSRKTFHLQKSKGKQFGPQKFQHSSNLYYYNHGHKCHSDNRENNRPTKKFIPSAQYKRIQAETPLARTHVHAVATQSTSKAFTVQLQTLNAKSAIKLDTSPVIVS